MPDDALTAASEEPTSHTGVPVMASGVSSRKASHRGTCQAFNHVHKLPGDLIAKHGYVIDSYTFIDVCPGSAHLPFQQSCEFARTCLAVKQRELESLREQDGMLREPATVASCWVSEARPRGYGERGRSLWRFVDIKWDGKNVYHIGFNGKEVTHRGAAVGAASLLAVASLFNVRYADQVVARNIVQAERYIGWMQDRLATWAPAPLLPLDGKVIYEPFNPPSKSA